MSPLMQLLSSISFVALLQALHFVPHVVRYLFGIPVVMLLAVVISNAVKSSTYRIRLLIVCYALFLIVLQLSLSLLLALYAMPSFHL